MSHQPGIVTMHHGAVQVVQAVSLRHLPNECGGILLGYREGLRIVVTHVLEVPTSAPAPTRYVRDDAAANELLSDFLGGREADDPIGYVGEWHSHPKPSGPSNIDIDSLRATARELRTPLALLICTPGHDTQLAAVVTTRDRLGRIRTRSATLGLLAPGAGRLGPLPSGAVQPDGPVFISYRHSDGYDSATHLEGLLQAAGIIVWRDERDLRGGTTVGRLERALTSGLSGAVLVVTPDLAYSTVVKELELPRLLQLDEDLAFSLNIANEIAHPRNPSRPDYDAPDRLLGLAPARTLADKKHSDTRTSSGQRQIVRDLLMHRIEERRAAIQENARTLTLTIQTRSTPFASEADGADLHIRISPAHRGRLPRAQGLEHLQVTLPVTSDAIGASGASTVRISGGAHISVAFAVGAALPATKVAHVEARDLDGRIWTSRAAEDADPGEHTITATSTSADFDTPGAVPIAVFVSLTDAADSSAFERLTESASNPFRSVSRIHVTPASHLHPNEAARVSASIAHEIRRLSAEHGRAEVHLAYHGPYTIAVLIGRLLNTIRTVVYEWDNPKDDAPRYIPSLRLEPGMAEGPITRVLISDPVST